MKNIVVFGAGMSASVLIDYLAELAPKNDWVLSVGDRDLKLAKSKTKDRPNTHAFQFNVTDEMQRLSEISKADIVVSMLPAHMHVDVAKECIALKKHMVTASYISEEMQALDAKAKAAGVVIMNEIGVDPGIDHMSAMRVLDEIRDLGGEMLQFETFTGGLPAPKSDDNPWHYKFAWNPRNVVLAGSGGAVKFKQEGKYKYIPYHQVFRRTERIEIPEYGLFEGYANRDSLKYQDVYGLEEIPTIYRGTLRRKGFSKAWDVFVKLGATDDSYELEDSETMTYRGFLNSFLAYNPNDSVELKLMHYLKIDQDNDIMEKMESLDIFSETVIGIPNATPAKVLQHILEQKWSMDEEDLDMIVMYHLFGYELNGERIRRESYMVLEGEDRIRTAMAKTVGLPVAIATRMILNGRITTPGVLAPISKEVYTPVLEELEEAGVRFTEKQSAYSGY
ncbi:MAG: saccharopine dehydrogenase NADP-binding domain-containing protein [Flavobacteriales bacterium]|nr:saccharopine dehydrogenase NADP-binding domain-containing protein [Flavobacteriales bacterium]